MAVSLIVLEDVIVLIPWQSCVLSSVPARRMARTLFWHSHLQFNVGCLFVTMFDARKQWTTDIQFRWCRELYSIPFHYRYPWTTPVLHRKSARDFRPIFTSSLKLLTGCAMKIPMIWEHGELSLCLMFDRKPSSLHSACVLKSILLATGKPSTPWEVEHNRFRLSKLSSEM